MVTCVHCGEQHPEEARFCSATGQSIPPPVATERVRPLGDQKGVFDLLKEAGALYRANARTFLITAALLFVPGAFISSCALSVVLAPVMVATPAAEQAAERMAQRSEELARRMKEHATRAQTDPRAAEETAREYEQQMRQLGREATQLGSLAVGGFVVLLLGLAGWAITALILYGFVLPLTHGALTIAVADRILGGEAGWREHWTLLLRRLGLLLSAIVPAALLVMIGYFFFVLPGIVLSFLFVFVTPVALIEGLGGTAALRRSYQLVRSDWLRTAIILITFGIASAVAHWTAGIFVPRGAFFISNFLGDLLLLAIMPVPIIGSVLLYFDLRRKVDGLTDDALKAELEALRPVI
jgi:hypothetical protein